MKKILTFSVVAALIIIAAACQKEAPNFEYYYYAPEDIEVLNQHLDVPTASVYDYDVKLPNHLLGFGVAGVFIANHDRATLGRVLFYDEDLSKDRSISCASCHNQSIAFSDNKAFSDGIEGRQTARNSQPLGSIVNFAAYYGVDRFGSNSIQFFWDERAGTVMDQCRETFANPNEMGMKMNEIVARVKEKEYYPILFKKAFGNGLINEENVLNALAEFINSMGSFNSKYDQVFSREAPGRQVTDDFAGFSQLENQGKRLYQQNCASCHGQNISRPQVIMAHNGLEMRNNDKGKGGHTGRSSDEGLFKVHTLRNIALTAPYMHDGRFATLDDVLDHYSHGIQSHPNLGSQLKNGLQPKKMNFTDTEREALKAFLHTLTDEGFLVDVKYSDPFKR